MYFILIILLTINCAFSESGHVRFVKGEVFIGDKIAVKGQFFNNEDIIATKANSLAIISLNEGSTLKLHENTTVVVNQLADNNTPTRVTMSLGSIVVNALKSVISSKLKQKFILGTKSASMGVRGTTFFASYGKKESKDLWMCVNEGEVAVKSNLEESEKIVKSGEGVRVTNGEKTSEPKMLPWTKNLNWNFQSDNENELANKVNIEDAYLNPLDFYYE